MHTALVSTVWHAISDKVLEIDTMTGEVLPHQAEAWEVIDPEGLELRLTLRPDIFIQNVAPWNGRQWTGHDVAWNLERMAGFTAEEEGIARSAFQRASMVQNLESGGRDRRDAHQPPCRPVLRLPRSTGATLMSPAVTQSVASDEVATWRR